MKRLILAAMLAMSPIAACTPTPSPANVADMTKLDEQAGLAVELAYQAANRTIFFANRAGLLNAAQKAQASTLDSKAFAAVLVVRSAYKTGNAATYSDAVATAYLAVQQLTALTK